MRKYLFLILLLILKVTLSVSQNSILLIGNSLTYFNELPLQLNILCKLNAKNINIKMVAYPGYSLYNHLTTIIEPTNNPNLVFTKRINSSDTIIPEAIKQLKAQKWDYIYLQDREAQEDSIEFAIKQIRELAPSSKIILFQNYMYDSKWSKKYDLKKKKNNIKEFKYLAGLVNADIIPISEVFEKIKKKQLPDMLYDNTMHPTYLGTIIMAILLYKTIYKNEEVNLNPQTFKVTDQEWEIIKKIKY